MTRWWDPWLFFLPSMSQTWQPKPTNKCQKTEEKRKRKNSNKSMTEPKDQERGSLNKTEKCLDNNCSTSAKATEKPSGSPHPDQQKLSGKLRFSPSIDCNQLSHHTCYDSVRKPCQIAGNKLPPTLCQWRPNGKPGLPPLSSINKVPLLFFAR
jgi:hypothetical protein